MVRWASLGLHKIMYIFFANESTTFFFPLTIETRMNYEKW